MFTVYCVKRRMKVLLPGAFVRLEAFDTQIYGFCEPVASFISTLMSL